MNPKEHPNITPQNRMQVMHNFWALKDGSEEQVYVCIASLSPLVGSCAWTSQAIARRATFVLFHLWRRSPI